LSHYGGWYKHSSVDPGGRKYEGKQLETNNFLASVSKMFGAESEPEQMAKKSRR
jgi:hypothetical protein